MFFLYFFKKCNIFEKMIYNLHINCIKLYIYKIIDSFFDKRFYL